MLDEQAKADYRRRLADLREELEDAKRLGSVDRAERIKAEIDALTKELSRAVGLGGRNRRAASASERARQTINKSIKVVLEKVTQNDPTLGGMTMLQQRLIAILSKFKHDSACLLAKFEGVNLAAGRNQ